MTPTNLDKIKQFVAEWKRKRDAADAGNWNSKIFFEIDVEDVEFCDHAANHSDQAMQIIEVLAEALSKFENVQKFVPRQTDDDPLFGYPAQDALISVAEILEGGK